MLIKEQQYAANKKQIIAFIIKHIIQVFVIVSILLFIKNSPTFFRFTNIKIFNNFILKLQWGNNPFSEGSSLI
jgi:hypothetical protein